MALKGLSYSFCRNALLFMISISVYSIKIEMVLTTRLQIRVAVMPPVGVSHATTAFNKVYVAKKPK